MPSALAILSVCSAGDHLLMVGQLSMSRRASSATRRLAAAGHHDQLLRRRATTSRPLLQAEHQGGVLRKPRLAHLRDAGHCRPSPKAAHAMTMGAGASVLMDNTWATPLFFQPLKHGVDLSIQAGHQIYRRPCRCDAGLCQPPMKAMPRGCTRPHGNMGLYASGDDCFLALRGLRTLAVRLARHQETGPDPDALAAGPAGSRARPVSRAAKRSRPCPVEAGLFAAPAACSAWY